MALSSRDCLSLQAFAEHSEVCDDLISLVARARFQFAGRARSVKMNLDGNAKIEEMSALPSSCDASKVMTLCSDRTMRVCCLDSQQVIHQKKDAFEQEPKSKVTLNVIPMKMIMTSGKSISLWSPSCWTCTNVGTHESQITTSSPVFNGTHLAVGGGSGSGLGIWDIENGKCTSKVLEGSEVTHVTKLDQNTLALGLHRCRPIVFDLRTNETSSIIDSGSFGVSNIQSITPTRIAVTDGQYNGCSVYELKGNGLYSKSQMLTHDDGRPQYIKAVDNQSKLLASTTVSPSALYIWSLSKNWMGWMDRAIGREEIHPLNRFPLSSQATAMTVLNDTRLAVALEPTRYRGSVISVFV